jgi:hypothetical protein
MKWKRITGGAETRCAARGCAIPAGARYWLARWETDDGTQEAHYCEECGYGSQAHPGDTLYGVWGVLLLAAVFLVVLPLLWPQWWVLWLALFVLVLTVVAVVTTRLFLRIYPNRPPRESQLF